MNIHMYVVGSEVVGPHYSWLAIAPNKTLFFFYKKLLIFFSFFMKTYCGFSLEAYQRGASNIKVPIEQHVSL